jgi:hypothetical protein
VVASAVFPPASPFVSSGLASAIAPPPRVFALLRWACVALFLGRAWQHLRWDAPYRALFWSQGTMEPLVSGLFGVPWQTYATSPAVAATIGGGIKLLGIFHLACAFAAWRCQSPAFPFSPTPSSSSAPAPRRWPHALLIAGSLALTFLAYCAYRDRLHRIGEFVEHASQFSLPLVLALAARGVLTTPRLILVLRVAVACTFAGHGLYAVGFYPTPGEWITLTMAATGLSEPASFTFLRLAGLLDFVVAAAVLLPWIRLHRPTLAYAAAWGLLTALARPAAFVRWDNLADSSAQWLHEAVLRLPHAALPLAALWLLRASNAPAPMLFSAQSPSDITLPPFALPRIHHTPSRKQTTA